ncbi:10897_t:CDS:2, partial [Acaulospora colombiana]
VDMSAPEVHIDTAGSDPGDQLCQTDGSRTSETNVSNEIPEFLNLLKELKGKVKEIKDQISVTTSKVKEHQTKTNHGISILDVKYHTLLQYITNLAFLIHMKLQGKSIVDHPVILNLVELRIVLEKIKPIEQKLKYQIDKLIRATVMEEDNDKVDLTSSAADPLSFKPNPQNLISESEEKREKGEDDTGIYKAPKFAPMHFDENKGNRFKSEKEQSRMLARASKSRIMKDLIAEYDDRPEEVDIIGGVHGGTVADERLEKELEERRRYEEENFIRLPMSKKELQKIRDRTKFEDEFENLNDFGSLTAIQDDTEAFEKQRTNILVRRNARKEGHRGQRSSDDDDGDGSRDAHQANELFDGLMTDLSQDKKRKNKFQKAKRNMKRQKRR